VDTVYITKQKASHLTMRSDAALSDKLSILAARFVAAYAVNTRENS